MGNLSFDGKGVSTRTLFKAARNVGSDIESRGESASTFRHHPSSQDVMVEEYP